MSDKISFKDLKSVEKQVSAIVNIKSKTIRINQYLPVNEKLAIITRVLQATAQNDYNFVNPVQLYVYTMLEIAKAYTNIEFSEEDLASPADLFDELKRAGIIAALNNNMNKDELNFVINGAKDTVEAYYKYQNSALGILEIIQNDYSGLDLDADKIKEKIADPENLSLLKDVMTKLG